MRKASKSARFEVIALSLFIIMLAFYAAFFTVGSSARAEINVDAGTNTDCKTSWEKFKKQGENQPDPAQYADEKNGQMRCGNKGLGWCNRGEGSSATDHVTVCGADRVSGQGEKMGTPEETAKAAMKAAEDLAKQAGEKKGGEQGGGGGMPQLPQPPQKSGGDKSADANGNCPVGQEKVGLVCKVKSAAADFNTEAGKSTSTLQTLLDSFKKTFGFNDSGVGDDSGMTLEERLQKIADQIDADPTIATASKPAMRDFAKVFIEKNGIAPTKEQIKVIADKPIEEIPRTATALDDATKELNVLVPSGGTFTEGHTTEESNILNRVFTWFKSLF